MGVAEAGRRTGDAGGLAGGNPALLVGTSLGPHCRPAAPRAGDSVGSLERALYARVRRQHQPIPKTSVRKVFSTAWLLSHSWAWRGGRGAGWAGHVSRGHVPLQSWPARRAATSRRPDK